MTLEAWLASPVISALIIMCGAIILAALFRKQVRSFIDRANSLKAAVNKEGVSVDLTAGAGNNPALPSQPIVPANAPRNRLIDPRLQYLVPPLEPAKYQTVFFPTAGVVNHFVWPLSPMGIFVVNGVPFYFEPITEPPERLVGHQILDILPAEGNKPNQIDLQVRVANVTAVHFIVAAGNGWTRHRGVQYMNKSVGYIELKTTMGVSLRTNLVLGHNLREWAFGNNTNLVREANDAAIQPAWVSHDNSKRLDMLTIKIDGGPIDLECVSIVAVFEDQVDLPHNELPAVIVSAITCERDT